MSLSLLASLPTRRAVRFPSTAEGQLPFERYTLANGLTVLLHPHSAAPLVHVEVTYRVGSGDDALGHAGQAHFCEHLLFAGSQHVAPGEHQRRVKAAGGSANALTDRDRTTYYQTAPAGELEMLLWLEADRMGFRADTLTTEAVETERAVITQERTQTYDARAYGRTTEYASQVLYGSKHPYSWLPIGTQASIAGLTLADLQDFFRRWYVPSNAILTIGGHFTPAQARQWVARYFEGLPSTIPPVRPSVPAPTLVCTKHLVATEAVHLPLVQVTLPTVPRHHAHELALDALAEHLGQGRNSLLFQRLVRTQQAVQVAASHSTNDLSGELTISIVGQAGSSPAVLEDAAWAALRDVGQSDQLPDALLSFANRRSATLLGKLDSLAERVRHLAEHERQLQQPNYLPSYLAQLHALQLAQVQQAHATYLAGKSAVVVHVLPGTPSSAPTTLPVAAEAPATTAPSLLPPLPPLTDGLDRRIAPVPAPFQPAPVPAPWRALLGNGLKIIGDGSSAIPSCTLVLGLPGGRRLEQGAMAATSKAFGVAALTAAMLNEGSRRYASAEFTAALNRLGSVIHASTGPDQTTIYVQTLSKHLGATLSLLEERLLYPRFEAADFARLRQQTLQAIGQQQTQAAALADRLLAQRLYGPSDVLSQPLTGTRASVSALGLTEVQAFYQRAYQPAGAGLAVAGNLDLAQLLPHVDFLRNWSSSGTSEALASLATPVPPPARRVHFLPKAGAQQAELRLGCLAPSFDATGEHFQATLVSFLLGGSPSSRLAQRLRHQHGYAYSVRSTVAGLRCAGPLVIQATVRPETTGAAIGAIIDELAALHEHVHEDDCQFLRTSLRQLDARRYETNQQRAFWLLQLAQHDLPLGYVHEQHAILDGLTPTDLMAWARRLLPLEQLCTVVVGDGPSVLPVLRASGYEVLEMRLNPAGELVPA
jgi:zinc protease